MFRPGDKIRRPEWAKRTYVEVVAINPDENVMHVATDNHSGPIQVQIKSPQGAPFFERYDPFPFWEGAKIRRRNEDPIEIIAIAKSLFLALDAGQEKAFPIDDDWELVVDTPEPWEMFALQIEEEEHPIVYSYKPRDARRGESLWRVLVTPIERLEP